MARTKQTARRSTGFKAPRKVLPKKITLDNADTIDTLWPVKEGPAPMTAKQQEQIAAEDRYRDLFANHRHNSELNDPHLLLTDVFSNHSQLVYAAEEPDEAQVPKILTSQRVLGRRGPCFASEQQFLSNWCQFTNGILDGLDWNNVFAAGGSVLANATANRDTDHFASSDIDLFLYGLDSDEQANKKLQHIYDVVSKHSKTTEIVRSFRAVTILGSFPDYRHVQIILKLYKSPAEVLLGFDVDCCSVGFDGKKVWALDRCIRAVSKGYNLVNMSRRSLSYETRLRKYSKRGYAVAVPNLDKAQVSVELFRKSAADVQGLAKLLIYEYYDRNPPVWSGIVRSYSTHKVIPARFMRTERRSHNMNADNIDIVKDITGTEDSDYAEYIPWGPSWYSGTILAMLNYKDRASTFGGKRATQQFMGKKEKPAIVHNHSYVTGIKGVIEGRSNNFWCRYCRQNKPLEQGEDGKDVCGPLHWVNENQVMQDLDKGFRRSFGGSFQPVLQENWAEGVYAAGYQARDSPHPLTQVTPPSTSNWGMQPAATSTQSLFGNLSTPSQDLYVGSGGQHFESQNQMLRFARENTGAQQAQSAPSSFGNDVEAFNGKPSVDIFAQSVQAFGGGSLPFMTTTTSDTPSKSTIMRNLNSPRKSPAPRSSGPSTYSLTSNNNNNYTMLPSDNKPTRTVPPAWWSLFGNGRGSIDSQMSYASQALLLVAALHRKGAITMSDKSRLKDLILVDDPLVKSVVEAFFVDSDLVEIVDSFTRVLEISKKC